MCDIKFPPGPDCAVKIDPVNVKRDELLHDVNGNVCKASAMSPPTHDANAIDIGAR